MKTTTIIFPADPDLSDVRAMVLRTVEDGVGDAMTATAIATRLGLPISSVQAVLLSLVRSGHVVVDPHGYASALQLID